MGEAILARTANEIPRLGGAFLLEKYVTTESDSTSSYAANGYVTFEIPEEYRSAWACSVAIFGRGKQASGSYYYLQDFIVSGTLSFYGTGTSITKNLGGHTASQMWTNTGVFYGETGVSTFSSTPTAVFTDTTTKDKVKISFVSSNPNLGYVEIEKVLVRFKPFEYY